MYLEHLSLSRECPNFIVSMYFRVKIQKVLTVVNLNKIGKQTQLSNINYTVLLLLQWVIEVLNFNFADFSIPGRRDDSVYTAVFILLESTLPLILVQKTQITLL